MSKKAKTVDRKGKAADFFRDGLRRFINEDINTSDLARVIKYDKVDHRCSVQPLPLQSDGDKRAPLVECIVPSAVWQLDEVLGKLSGDWKPMKVNSVVRVAFLDHDADEWTGKANYKTSGRMHSIQDPIIAEVVKP